MVQISIDPLLNEAARLFLAGLLLASAAHKARMRIAFTGTVAAYRLLPARLARPFATILPLAEASVAFTLLLPGAAAAGGMSAAGLFALYFLAIAINLARGRTTIDCGCSLARRGSGISFWHLVRLALLIGLAGAAGIMPAGRAMGLFDHVNAAAAVMALTMLYVAIELVLANHTAMRPAAQDREAPADA